MFYNTTKLDNTRYDLSLLLSYKRQVSMVVGDRRVGKTFRVLRECVKVALKTHSLSFVWLRITKKESDEIKDTFFDDIIAYNVFPDYSFKVSGNLCYASLIETGETFPIGYISFVKNAQTIKGMTFPNVKYVVLDEFMQEEGTLKCKSVVTLLNSILYSVFSLRPIRAILIGNAVTMINPFFVHFGIRDICRPFTKGKNYVIENVNYEKRYEKFRENAKSSEFGRLVEGTDYEKYALENKFVLDDTSDVRKVETNENDLVFAIKLEHLINVYITHDYIYFKSVKKTATTTYTPITTLAKSGIIYMKYNSDLFKKLFSLINSLKIVYDTLLTKDEIIALMKKVNGSYDTSR